MIHIKLGGTNLIYINKVIYKKCHFNYFLNLNQ